MQTQSLPSRSDEVCQKDREKPQLFVRCTLNAAEVLNMVVSRKLWRLEQAHHFVKMERLALAAKQSRVAAVR